ncbi:MAG TPA: hypothetical protein VFI42_15620 [Thermomicrobiaceae bacterium]|nr:hypothetical protein [Thermomicrobiaceae bacterium]
MPDDLDRLLKYIAQHYTGRARAKEVERDAAAEEPDTTLVASERNTIAAEERRAESMAAAFRDGLLRAIAARRAGGNAISLDDRVPEENRMADALVHFLVGADLADSTTREIVPMHYVYTIAIDWKRLAAVAAEAHVNLDTLLGQ